MEYVPYKNGTELDYAKMADELEKMDYALGISASRGGVFRILPLIAGAAALARKLANDQ